MAPEVLEEEPLEPDEDPEVLEEEPLEEEEDGVADLVADEEAPEVEPLPVEDPPDEEVDPLEELLLEEAVLSSVAVSSLGGGTPSIRLPWSVVSSTNWETETRLRCGSLLWNDRAVTFINPDRLPKPSQEISHWYPGQADSSPEADSSAKTPAAASAKRASAIRRAWPR